MRFHSLGEGQELTNSHKISYKMSSSKKLGKVMLGQFYVKVGSKASKV